MNPHSPVTPHTFGARLRSLRRRRALTQARLALQVGEGMAGKHIAEYELGHRYPGYRNLCRLAKALSVSLSELLEGVET